jgi:hypothetical protein
MVDCRVVEKTVVVVRAELYVTNILPDGSLAVTEVWFGPMSTLK